jgi:hypothetical protein
MSRRGVSSDQAPEALGPYSQAIVAGNMVFCSGMAGIDPATGEAVDGIEAQTEQPLLNLTAGEVRARTHTTPPRSACVDEAIAVVPNSPP